MGKKRSHNYRQQVRKPRGSNSPQLAPWLRP